MTLQQLRYMIEIVQSGSMNEAARRLFVTQPSLSAAVKELENELGIELFLRTRKGIALSSDGAEFLGYARQVVEQADLLAERYSKAKPSSQRFSVSTQHYAFVVNAFVNLIGEYGVEEYDFTLRETQTYEIIEDVKNLRSEVGVLYRNSFNEKVLNKLFHENGLEFQPILTANPHIFISRTSPLASKKAVTLEDLEPYPCLSFEQGEYNSFYFSEEILSTLEHKKSIRVSDRASLFNLLIGLDGYTISTGMLSTDLNGTNIVAVPLLVPETIEVGWISYKKASRTRLGSIFLEQLELMAKKYNPV